MRRLAVCVKRTRGDNTKQYLHGIMPACLHCNGDINMDIVVIFLVSAIGGWLIAQGLNSIFDKKSDSAGDTNRTQEIRRR